MDDMKSLVVLWSSADKDVALTMVFMYVLNSKLKKWWENVTFIIWGPSAELTAEDTQIQENLIQMKNKGIKLEACRACADHYNVSHKLENLGIDVKYMGEVLTGYIKNGYKVLTF